MQQLAQKMDSPPMGLLGVSACNQREVWRYYIAVSSTRPAEGFEEYILPAATWPFFPGKGPFSSYRNWSAGSLPSGSPPQVMSMPMPPMWSATSRQTLKTPAMKCGSQW